MSRSPKGKELVELIINNSHRCDREGRLPPKLTDKEGRTWVGSPVMTQEEFILYLEMTKEMPPHENGDFLWATGGP